MRFTQRNLTLSKTIADIININLHHLRSTHLERDFSNPDSCTGYIVTDFIESCLERLAEGLQGDSNRRAWRLTGDYGTGKSSFALVLAHLFSNHQSGILKELRNSIKMKGLCFDNLNLVPILITGNRSSLRIALQSVLCDSILKTIPKTSKVNYPNLLQKILNENLSITDDEIVEGFIQYSQLVKSKSKGSGVLLILDELGKFLEFSAMYPDSQDIYLLQQLAEAASRSGGTPFFVLGLLHQGINAYTDHLDAASKREWEKVAGRYDEILFNQPLEQVVHLLSSALMVRTSEVSKVQQKEIKTQMKNALKYGWYGPVPLHEKLLDKAPYLFPLDPLAIPVISRTMYHFGQNERSLFSFLQSSEPFALQAYASQHPLRDAELYRIYNFYDYVRDNMSHSLNITNIQTHWSIVNTVISSYISDDSLEMEILKTVGMLNLLNANDLIPLKDLVIHAVKSRNNPSDRISNVIETLINEKNVLYDRGIAGGLCLWPHTSVDLNTAYKNAERAVADIGQVSERIKTHLDVRPIVARRHYIETGNLRHFEIQYLSASEFSKFTPSASEDEDGTILIVLCDSLQEQKQALKDAETSKYNNFQQLLIAIPDPLEGVLGYLRDYLCWEWVGQNTLELNTDSYARQEVSRQRDAAHVRLKKRTSDLIDLRGHLGKMRFNWFSEGKSLPISTGKQLLKHLSNVCDQVYHQSPKVQSELINRQNLSTAASGARMSLIRAMLEREPEPNLGMPEDKRPPEMSMYLSVLKQGNIHVEGEKTWYIQEPPDGDDPNVILPALKQIEVLLKSSEDNKVTVPELFAKLRKPPYGVRDGLIPLLLAIFYVAHRQEISIFEDGTFLREVRGDDFYRLIRAPEYFAVQHSAIEGIRASVFNQMIQVLEISQTSDKQDLRILDVVMPLCNFVSQLPEYVHKTKKLSPEAIAVREKLMSGAEPAPLLFRDLPIAYGEDPFDITQSIDDNQVHKFAESIKYYLTELKNAYTELLERIKYAIFQAFEEGYNTEGRNSIAKRADNLWGMVSEYQLKAFCGRLKDKKLSETKWIESIANLVISDSPSSWDDSDENVFQYELAALVTRFKHVESIYHAAKKIPKNHNGINLMVTHAEGSERSEVVYSFSQEKDMLADIEGQIQSLFEKHGRRLGLTAIARVVWSELNDIEKESDKKEPNKEN